MHEHHNYGNKATSYQSPSYVRNQPQMQREQYGHLSANPTYTEAARTLSPGERNLQDHLLNVAMIRRQERANPVGHYQSVQAPGSIPNHSLLYGI